MPQLFILALGLLPWIPAFLCGVTKGEFKVLEGQSLIVPCHYEPQYAGYVKYWCWGATREFCSSLARTDDSPSADPGEDKVSISDDQAHLVFTVTMNHLKEEDSGWYMCGVEIGSVWSADVVTLNNIKVIHGLSVVSNQLSGQEGSSVSVECHYSEKYRESAKKWCRSGDWSSCLLTGSEGSYEDTSVAISDDRTRTFTVTLKRLQMNDSGWYWCSAGQQQISVHVLVTPRPTTTAVSVTSPSTPSQSFAHLPPARPITTESWNNHILESLPVCASLMLLFLCIAVLGRKMWNLHNPQYQFLEQDPVLRDIKEMKAKNNKYSGDGGDLPDVAVAFLNRDSNMYQA